MNSGGLEWDLSLCVVWDIIKSGSTKRAQLTIFWIFAVLWSVAYRLMTELAHAQTVAHATVNTYPCRTLTHSVMVPPCPAQKHIVSRTLIRNESFWSVAVGCQISSDIISPKNSLLPSFNIHSYTFNLPLCICNTVRRVCIQRCPNLLPKCIQFLETHMIPTLHVYCNAR